MMSYVCQNVCLKYVYCIVYQNTFYVSIFSRSKFYINQMKWKTLNGIQLNSVTWPFQTIIWFYNLLYRYYWSNSLKTEVNSLQCIWNMSSEHSNKTSPVREKYFCSWLPDSNKPLKISGNRINDQFFSYAVIDEILAILKMAFWKRWFKYVTWVNFSYFIFWLFLIMEFIFNTTF